MLQAMKSFIPDRGMDFGAVLWPYTIYFCMISLFTSSLVKQFWQLDSSYLTFCLADGLMRLSLMLHG